MLPFNIELLDVSQATRALKPIRVLDTFEGNTTNFHPDGLFSTEIFGRVGEEARDRRFSYIELNTTILHPIIYRTLLQLKRLYGSIMDGSQFAVWDDKEKDFFPSDPIAGSTGYAFFISHWRELKFKPARSPIRSQRVKLIQKYQDGLSEVAEVSRVIVIPAGFRDADIAEDGHRTEDEINSFYRTILRIANTIGFTTGDGKGNQSSIIDNSRFSMQTAFIEVYTHLNNLLLRGKHSFFPSKVASRRVYNGTRGVFTSLDMKAGDLRQPNYPRFNNTVLGLHQSARGALPKVIYGLRTGWLHEVFTNSSGVANLVNKKTLKREEVSIPAEVYDYWTSQEGLEKVVAELDDRDIRNRPITINDHYLGLVYVSPSGKKPLTYRIFNDIDELPTTFSKEDVVPLSLTLLIYLSGLDFWDKLCLLTTRYPISGQGSIYTSELYLKVTLDSTVRDELGADWQPTGKQAIEFPALEDDANYIDTIIPPGARLGEMQAD